MFVMTKLLSRQNYVCCDETFVTANICRDNTSSNTSSQTRLSRQNTSFAVTKLYLLQQNFCCDKVMFVQTKYFCCDKTFVMTNICHNKQVFVATTVLSWQAYKSFVATKIFYVTFCHNMHTFVMTKDLFCYGKHLFVVCHNKHVCHDKAFVAMRMILVAAPANAALLLPELS